MAKKAASRGGSAAKNAARDESAHRKVELARREVKAEKDTIPFVNVAKGSLIPGNFQIG